MNIGARLKAYNTNILGQKIFKKGPLLRGFNIMKLKKDLNELIQKYATRAPFLENFTIEKLYFSEDKLIVSMAYPIDVEIAIDTYFLSAWDYKRYIQDILQEIIFNLVSNDIYYKNSIINSVLDVTIDNFFKFGEIVEKEDQQAWIDHIKNDNDILSSVFVYHSFT